MNESLYEELSASLDKIRFFKIAGNHAFVLMKLKAAFCIVTRGIKSCHTVFRILLGI